LKLEIFGLRFLRFLNSTSKKRKKSHFGIFKKNVKTYSRTMAGTIRQAFNSRQQGFTVAGLRILNVLPEEMTSAQPLTNF